MMLVQVILVRMGEHVLTSQIKGSVVVVVQYLLVVNVKQVNYSSIINGEN